MSDANMVVEEGNIVSCYDFHDDNDLNVVTVSNNGFSTAIGPILPTIQLHQFGIRARSLRRSMDYIRRSAVDDDRSRRIRRVVDDDRHQRRWAVDNDRSRIAFYQAQVKASLDRVDKNLDRISKNIRSIRRMRIPSVTISTSLSSLLTSASRDRNWFRNQPAVVDDYPPLQLPLRWRDPLPDRTVRNHFGAIISTTLSFATLSSDIYPHSHDSSLLQSHSIAPDPTSAFSCDPISLPRAQPEPIGPLPSNRAPPPPQTTANDSSPTQLQSLLPMKAAKPYHSISANHDSASDPSRHHTCILTQLSGPTSPSSKPVPPPVFPSQPTPTTTAPTPVCSRSYCQSALAIQNPLPLLPNLLCSRSQAISAQVSVIPAPTLPALLQSFSYANFWLGSPEHTLLSFGDNHSHGKSIVIAVATASGDERNDGDRVQLLLTRIWELYIGYFNNYKSWIPLAIENPRKLVRLNKACCGRTVEISSEVGKLENIDTILLQVNGLAGELPSELGQLCSLKSKDLSNNTFMVETPLSFAGFNNRTLIHLFNNKLYGNIPDFISDQKGLEVIHLWKNTVTESIPQHPGMKDRLLFLDFPSCDGAHREKRILLKPEIEKMIYFIVDQPSLLVPNSQVVFFALALAQYKVICFFQHVGVAFSKFKATQVPIESDAIDSTVGFLLNGIQSLLCDSKWDKEFIPSANYVVISTDGGLQIGGNPKEPNRLMNKLVDRFDSSDDPTTSEWILLAVGKDSVICYMI
ncbi:hypothetical protein IEQ34_004507 [Dendrobium chrysotoxum]|uniref:Uncharacterized protein n=1 Tax=Dendrobium chrysotoxum TaxID=161865 RepID=A0AAV7HHF6_DENCH|nr:hypothetical protein IEQ34_004507 [Dendrobium chrysotoxum]